jgi:hypothetical protein
LMFWTQYLPISLACLFLEKYLFTSKYSWCSFTFKLILDIQYGRPIIDTSSLQTQIDWSIYLSIN